MMTSKSLQAFQLHPALLLAVSALTTEAFLTLTGITVLSAQQPSFPLFSPIYSTPAHPSKTLSLDTFADSIIAQLVCFQISLGNQ